MSETPITSQQQTELLQAQSRQVTTESLWQETPQQLCTSNSCATGHIWPVVVAIAKCPGCAQAVLAIKMVNCPICNEPTQRTVLRTDHMPHGGALTAICKGAASLADVGQIELLRRHAQAEQEAYKERGMIGKV